jgi:hypothetical protein
VALTQVVPVPDHKQDDSSGFLAEMKAVTESLGRSRVGWAQLINIADGGYHLWSETL